MPFPFNPTAGSGAPGRDQPQPRPAVSNQVYLTFTRASDAYAHGLYCDGLCDDDVERFLKESSFYDTSKKKWLVPKEPGSQNELLDAISRVISSIIEGFAKSGKSGLERKLVDIRVSRDGQRVELAPHCPALVVRAAGPSFEIPNPVQPPPFQVSGLGYANIATYFSVKLDSEADDDSRNLDEMLTYARRIFREQPNRIHVRSLVVTESHARLIHFDRGGCQITPPIDIHAHPETFVRLVAGLASANERTVGLDDSIQWDIIDGRKAQGTLTTTGENGEHKSYRILEQLPISHDSIFGRATTCWRVQDPDTLEVLIVKDSWRPEDRIAEYEFLKLVKGFSGVVHMVSHETERGETKDFRCLSTLGKYHNRIATRVTMHSYGESVQCFESVIQLLCALRDAIAGHQRLTEAGVEILHRDISPNNVLLGRRDAAEGDRGVIIDFDLAFRATEDCPFIIVDHTTGTRVFQSLSVIDSSTIRHHKHQHLYLDDLESFFYILTFIFLAFRPDGSRVPSSDEGAALIPQWDEYDPIRAADNKHSLFEIGGDIEIVVEIVEQHWGPICFKLFEQFHAWAKKIIDEKNRLLFFSGRRGREDPLESFYPQSEGHYAAVLNMFDQAIAAMQSESTGLVPNPPDAVLRLVPDYEIPVEDGPLLPRPTSIYFSTSKVGLGNSEDALSVPTPISATAQKAGVTLSVSTAPSVTNPVQPRRSGRIRSLRAAYGGCQSPHTGTLVMGSAQPALPAIPAPMIKVRRSARLLKRRLGEEDESVDNPPKPKARRTIKHRRVTAHFR